MEWTNLTFANVRPSGDWSSWRRCRVAGTSHRDVDELARFMMSLQSAGQHYSPDVPHLHLEREPDNPADPRAIGVWGRVISVKRGFFRSVVTTQSVQLGYLPAELIDRVGPRRLAAELKDAALGVDGSENAFSFEITVLRAKG